VRSLRVAKQKRKAKKHPGAHRAAGCWPPGSVYSSCLEGLRRPGRLSRRGTRRGIRARL